MPPKKKQAQPEEEEPVSEEELEFSEDDDDGNGDYLPPDGLGQPHFHRRTCSELVHMMEQPDLLDLNPDYQRDVVWSSDRMTKLINSLMTAYYVPPLIFNVIQVPLPTGKTLYKRVSIDGKQRLSSIREFVYGNIPTTDKKGRRWYYTTNGEGRSKRILPQKVKDRFITTELLCCEYANLKRSQEEDLFSRVQLGMPLTPAEKLRASSGDWQSFAIELEKDYQELLKVVDNKRGRGFQLILQVLKQILNDDDDLSPTYSAGAAALKGFCDRPQLLDENIRQQARRVFDRYTKLAQEYPNTFENHNYANAKKFSPVEFVGVAMLIFRYPDRNTFMLHGDVLGMREWIRTERQDLRSNTWTWQVIIKYIYELVIHRGGPGTRNPPIRQKKNSGANDNAGDNHAGDEQPRPKRKPGPKPGGAKALADKVSRIKHEKDTQLFNTPAPGVRVVDDDDDEGSIASEPARTPPPQPQPQPPPPTQNDAQNFASRFRAIVQSSQQSSPQQSPQVHNPGQPNQPQSWNDHTRNPIIPVNITKRRADEEADTVKVKREKLGPFSMTDD